MEFSVLNIIIWVRFGNCMCWHVDTLDRDSLDIKSNFYDWGLIPGKGGIFVFPANS
jgi:hypothetical protein